MKKKKTCSTTRLSQRAYKRDFCSHVFSPLSWRKGLESVLVGSAVFAGRLGSEGQ